MRVFTNFHVLSPYLWSTDKSANVIFCSCNAQGMYLDMLPVSCAFSGGRTCKSCKITWYRFRVNLSISKLHKYQFIIFHALLPLEENAFLSNYNLYLQSTYTEYIGLRLIWWTALEKSIMSRHTASRPFHSQVKFLLQAVKVEAVLCIFQYTSLYIFPFTYTTYI